MEGTYCVYMSKKPVGKIQVTRQGLYYQFHCRCQLSGDVVCRLVVACGNQSEKLGIVVPMEDGFGLDSSFPVKRFQKGEPIFSLVPKMETPEGKFIPIFPDEPFAYIEQLKKAFLIRKYGQTGILIN